MKHPWQVQDFNYALAIKELQKSGLSLAEIGRRIGCTRGRVWQLKNGVCGTSVKFELKFALYELCKKRNIDIYNPVDDVGSQSF